jgi:hypothetical protein
MRSNQMKNDWTLRRFLQTAGTLSALAGAQAKTVAAITHRGVSLVVNPSDPIAGDITIGEEPSNPILRRPRTARCCTPSSTSAL